MSIASGVPVPQVFVLDREDGINAFAAGFRPADAVIAVTRGVLVHLNRDELQGVIAHEFSHVLNGDMRLNMRLIGSSSASRDRDDRGHDPRFWPRSSGRKSGGGLAVIYLAALVVLLLGWIGLFFGRLIQGRSREPRIARRCLGGAVHARSGWTRNALVKIGALGAASRFADADVEEVAQLLFAEESGAFSRRILQYSSASAKSTRASSLPNPTPSGAASTKSG